MQDDELEPIDRWLRICNIRENLKHHVFLPSKLLVHLQPDYSHLRRIINEYPEYDHGTILSDNEDTVEFNEREGNSRNASTNLSSASKKSLPRAVFDRGGASNPHIMRQLDKCKDLYR